MQNAFVWTCEATATFLALKDAISHTLVLALLDFTKPFVLQTDAFGFEIGAMLVQSTHPIAFFSKELPPTVCNSSTYTREMYAITEAVKKWCQYLLDQCLTIETDHQSLRALINQTIQTPEQ